MTFLRWASLGLGLLIALLVHGREAITGTEQSAADRERVFTGATVIDGTGDITESDILVRDGTIVAVASELSIPSSAEEIVLDGFYVVPGLIDMHGHLYANNGERIQNEYEPYAALYLAGGVTTVYSPGEFDPEGAVAFRDAVTNGTAVGPRILTAGPYFDSAPSRLSWIHGAETIDAAIAGLDAWADRIDGVKVYTGATAELLESLIPAARSRGLLVTGHLAAVPARRAVALGIHGIEHGIFSFGEFATAGADDWDRICDLARLDVTAPEVIALMEDMIERAVYVDPTIVMFDALLPDFEPVVDDWKRYLAPAAAESFGQMWSNVIPEARYRGCLEDLIARQLEFVRTFRQRGGLIVAGTDPVAPVILPGFGLHRELRRLVDAGLTPMEAIQAGTYHAALALGRDVEIGSILPGKHADFLVVEGDPTKDIDALDRIVTVFRDGVPYDPELLRAGVVGTIGDAR